MKNLNVKKYVILLFLVSLLCSCSNITQKAEDLKVNEMKNNDVVETTVANYSKESVTAVEKSVNNKGADKITINEELKKVEEKANKLEKNLEEAMTQSDMNIISTELNKLWDDELNSLWNRIKEKDNEKHFSELKTSELNWIKEKDSKVKEEGKKYENGTMRPLVEATTSLKLTRKRVYYLAGYLGKLIGENVTPLAIEYEGYYVDTQGTAVDVYSDLDIKKQNDDSFLISIGLHRIGSIEGKAILNNGKLLFTANYPEGNEIEAEIITDGDSATLVFTNSTWEYIKNGDTFTFSEKWNERPEY